MTLHFTNGHLTPNFGCSDIFVTPISTILTNSNIDMFLVFSFAIPPSLNLHTKKSSYPGMSLSMKLSSYLVQWPPTSLPTMTSLTLMNHAITTTTQTHLQHLLGPPLPTLMMLILIITCIMLSLTPREPIHPISIPPLLWRLHSWPPHAISNSLANISHPFALFHINHHISLLVCTPWLLVHRKVFTNLLKNLIFTPTSSHLPLPFCVLTLKSFEIIIG